MPNIMGRKEKEMSPDIARVLQQPRSTISYIIRRFRESGTVVISFICLKACHPH
jgi:hypothetical protein